MTVNTMTTNHLNTEEAQFLNRLEYQMNLRK